MGWNLQLQISTWRKNCPAVRVGVGGLGRALGLVSRITKSKDNWLFIESSHVTDDFRREDPGDSSCPDECSRPNGFYNFTLEILKWLSIFRNRFYSLWKIPNRPFQRDLEQMALCGGKCHLMIYFLRLALWSLSRRFSSEPARRGYLQFSQLPCRSVVVVVVVRNSESQEQFPIKFSYQICYAESCFSSTLEQERVVRELRIGSTERSEDSSNCNRGSALNVVVEGTKLVAVLLEEPEKVVSVSFQVLLYVNRVSYSLTWKRCDCQNLRTESGCSGHISAQRRPWIRQWSRHTPGLHHKHEIQFFNVFFFNWFNEGAPVILGWRKPM